MGMGRALLESALIVLGCTLLGAAVNLVHPRGIPYVARQAYETLVPCPEPGGEVVAVAATDPSLEEAGRFFVDARDRAAAARWRFRDAVNVPYDYLDPTPEEVLGELARSIARSGARQVVVYGDGDRPDTGEQLAREISGHGIKNVVFVTGGAPALEALDDSAGSREAGP
jgi:hypothetical protein